MMTTADVAVSNACLFWSFNRLRAMGKSALVEQVALRVHSRRPSSRKSTSDMSRPTKLQVVW
jgi:hypothetical protein